MSWKSVATRRRASIVGVLLVAVAALVVVLVPALAATVTPSPPASGAGVTPQLVSVGTGGFSCSAVGSTAASQFNISSPRNGTFAIPGTPYSIVLSGLSRPGKINWSATGGLRVFDLGVKGEEGTTWYRYRPPVTPYPSPNQSLANGTAASGRLSDTGVHGRNGDGDDDDLRGLSFCYSPDASVTGQVYRDRNENGSFQSGTDTVLSGWTVKAYSGSTLLGTTTSKSDGTYAIPTGTGTVTVCVKPPSGTWEQTEPVAGTSCNGGSGQLANGASVAVTSTGGTANFGNLPPKVTVSGTAFLEQPPSNGQLDGTDAGQDGWTVTAYAQGGAPAPVVATTANGGQYTLSVRSLDTVTVCVAPTGTLKQTLPASGGGCAGAGQLENGRTLPLTSSDVTGADFGATVPDASVTGKTFVDRNSNGVLDTSGTPAETTSDGWTVRAYLGSSTTPYASATTANGGTYALDLPTTFTYTLCVVPPSGTWGQTLPSTGGGAVNSADEFANCRTVSSLASTGSADNDFAGVQANTTASCTDPAGFANQYEFQVQCGKLTGASFFTAYWTVDGKQQVLIHPVPDVPGGVLNPLVEKITWNYPGDDQNLITIYYDDDPAGGYGNETKKMKLCAKDPRTPGSEFGLGDTANTLPSGETSCLLTSTTLLDAAAPSGKRFVAYVYSEIDGFRSTG